MNRRIKLEGFDIGYWKVLRYYPAKKPGTYYLCRCVCGKEKIVAAAPLRDGLSLSCGCQRKRKEKSEKPNFIYY